MKRKLIVYGAIVVVLALLLSLAPACGNGDEDVTPTPGFTPTPGKTPTPVQTPTATPTGEVKTLKVGVSSPLSGPAAAYGVGSQIGAQWGADLINSAGGIKVGNDRYMIEIVSCDDKYMPSETGACGAMFVYDEGIHYVVGPLSHGDTLEPMFTDNNVLYVGQGGAVPPKAEFPNRVNGVVRLWDWVNAVYSMMHEHHPEVETVAVVGPENPSGAIFMPATLEIVPSYGLNLIDHKIYDPATADFYPVLSSIVAQNPDVIDTGASPPGSVALIVKAARELGYQGWILAMSGAFPDTLISIAGAENVWKMMATDPNWSSAAYPQRTRDLYNDWLTNYASAGETDLPTTTANAFKAMLFLRDAIEAAGTIDANEVLNVIDDPSFRFDIFGAENVQLGGVESFGIRRQFPHEINYGEIIDADQISFSLDFTIVECP